jgi:F0F1-type ATP synthase membrane subunit b/b'
MISLDWSIIPAIIIFIATIFALHFLLFRPVLAVQAEREKRTSGLMSKIRGDLDHHMHLFDQYQATIKNARLEGYRMIEKSRAEALQFRSNALDRARQSAEKLHQDARDTIRTQVAAAKVNLARDAQEIAGQIASAILQRPA